MITLLFVIALDLCGGLAVYRAERGRLGATRFEAALRAVAWPLTIWGTMTALYEDTTEAVLGIDDRW